MEEGIQTSMTNHTKSTSNDIIIDVRFEPVMQVVADILQMFLKGKRLILKAAGNAIPNAVAIANILLENMLKNDIHVENITVDSDAPPGIGMMTSTIQIILVREC